METYNVDVIVPVHSATRPIQRAVRSALESNQARVRVSVVAHNIDPEIIRKNLGELASHPDLRLLSLMDRIPSPSGPMNLGLMSATAPYFSLMGSDDEFAPGALDSWLTIARDTGATTVIARIERELSGVEPLPPTRRGRTRDLDVVKDRLSYRCAPLGLVSRKKFGHLRFTPGLESGEDLEFTAELWFTGSHIAYDRTGPAYIGHEGEVDRVTTQMRTVKKDFAHLDAIFSSTWFPMLNKKQRLAFGVKTMRLHIFDAIAARLEELEKHQADLVEVIDAIEKFAPGTTRLLSVCDRETIDALRHNQPDTQTVAERISERWSGGPRAILTRNPLLALHAQAPFRTLRNTRP